MDEDYGYFFKRVPAEIIRTLRRCKLNEPHTKMDLASEVGTTDSHAINVVNELAKLDVVKLEELDGRSDKVVLTEKGSELAEKVIEFREVLEKFES